MNITILHGPNINLIGSLSAKQGKQVTLDKINKELRRSVRNKDIQLKIEQTHKVYQAINFIQRNRNWADRMIFTPMSWARYEYSILDALTISNVKTIQILFKKGYSDLTESESIFSSVCDTTLIGEPVEVYKSALDKIMNSV